jgi:hypothetical protein
MSDPECEICSKSVPDDDRDGWENSPDGGDWDAGIMWFCPECIAKWPDNPIGREYDA